jgi:hypothetical protein
LLCPLNHPSDDEWEIICVADLLPHPSPIPQSSGSLNVWDNTKTLEYCTVTETDQP